MKRLLERIKKWWKYSPQVEAFKRGYRLGKKHMKEQMIYYYRFDREALDKEVQKEVQKAINKKYQKRGNIK